jgi:hypothetical protein
MASPFPLDLPHDPEDHRYFDRIDRLSSTPSILWLPRTAGAVESRDS